MNDGAVIDKYLSFLRQKDYPCVAAKAAVAKNHVHCFVADSLACPANDRDILKFLYEFVTAYRMSETSYHSAAVIFKGPQMQDETMFDTLFWERLKSLHLMDREKYGPDERVSDDPASANYSFSIMAEAFFVIGLHPASSRRARRFEMPTLVFNPHVEFVKLRMLNRYGTMKRTVRNRDQKFSGSVNPLLKDFGEESEVLQYSGLAHSDDWKCPLQP